MKQPGYKLPLNYLLRWRFDYANKSSVAGMWLNPGDGFNNSAQHTPKDGMVRAVVEAKDYKTHQVAQVAGCDAKDYEEFRWLGMTSLKSGSLPVHGLMLVTKTKKILTTIDGKIRTEQRN